MILAIFFLTDVSFHHPHLLATTLQVTLIFEVCNTQNPYMQTCRWLPTFALTMLLALRVAAQAVCSSHLFFQHHAASLLFSSSKCKN
jgi:hypothetical protein